MRTYEVIKEETPRRLLLLAETKHTVAQQLTVRCQQRLKTSGGKKASKVLRILRIQLNALNLGGHLCELASVGVDLYSSIEKIGCNGRR